MRGLSEGAPFYLRRLVSVSLRDTHLGERAEGTGKAMVHKGRQWTPHMSPKRIGEAHYKYASMWALDWPMALF